MANQGSQNTSAPLTIDDAIKLVVQIVGIVGDTPALTAQDKRRSLKLRKGAGAMIPIIVDAVKHFGVVVPSHPIDGVVEEMAKVNALVPLQQKLALALKQVEDKTMLASSEAYAAACVYYVMLRRLAKKDGEVAKAIAPVEAFFARRHPLVAKQEAAKRGHRKGTKAHPAPKAPPAPAPQAHAGDANGTSTDSTQHASGGNAHG